MNKIDRFVSKSAISVLTAVIVLSMCWGMAFGRSDNAQHQERFSRIDLQQFRTALKVHERNNHDLMEISGVVATSTGIGTDGEPVIKVFTSQPGTADIPTKLDNFPVVVKTSRRYRALAPTDRFPRPVPIGISTGLIDILAGTGTIGARVTDGTNVFALSNNHVYANCNNANNGDSIIQPGRYDGDGSTNDVIGTLFDFKQIEYCSGSQRSLSCPNTNTIDAAIAEVMDPTTSEPMVDFETPSDGYGAPNATIHSAYGIADTIDDADEDLATLIGQKVQKYGRSTGLTSGTVDSVNGTVDVCYNDDCTLIARFEDQIIINSSSFSAAGDSGSLIVTNDANKNPVGLLFAGGDTETIANRIDRVLIEFGVKMDASSQDSNDDSNDDSNNDSNDNSDSGELTCVTATNSNHINAGRAVGCGINWGGYYFQACAVGSKDNLKYTFRSSSVQETSPGYWEKVSSCP